MKAIVILATICFFWATTHTSSIRAEETEEAWKIVEEGPNKGSYKGKLWGLDALLSFSDDQKFGTINVNQQYSSEEAAVKTCERVGLEAGQLIRKYGPYRAVDEKNNKESNFILNGHSIKVRTPCLISFVNQENQKIRATLIVRDKTNMFSSL